MDVTLRQVSASIQSAQGFASSVHAASAVNEAMRSCAVSIPGKASGAASPEISGSPPRQSIDSFYQSPQDVTAPPPTRRGTHYNRPRSAPTITKSRKRVGARKVTGGDGDDDSGFDEQLHGGGDENLFWSGGSGGRWGGSGGSGGRSGGNWGGGNWGGRGDRGGGKEGDESWSSGDGGESIDWSSLAGQWQMGGRTNQPGLDALCSLYYRSLCWISLTRCIHHVLRSQFCMLDGVAEGMSVGARPVLARCSGAFVSRLGNCRLVAAV